jgi:acyl-CoA synthetase (AMP-forming)/AMP-acid ligase II
MSTSQYVIRAEPMTFNSLTVSKILIDAADPARYVSRRKATELVARMAGTWQPDTTVCLHLPNDVLYPVIALGIMASAARWTGTNTAYTTHELKHHLQVSKSKYIVTREEHWENVLAAVNEVEDDIFMVLFKDVLKPQLVYQPRARGVSSLYDFLGPLDKATYESWLARIESDDIAMLQSTSGTTGFPKMAARTHQSMMAEAQAIEEDDESKPYAVRRMFCTPIFHAFSTPEMLINTLRLGIPTYIMKRFDDTFPQKVQDFSITEIAAPPPMLLKLHQNRSSHRMLQGLRLIFTGGAPLTQELKNRFLSIFEVAPRLVQVWGMTEGGWFTTFKYPETDDTGSVGRCVPGCQIIVDPDTAFHALEGVEAGELLVKNSQLMTGYFGNQQATNEVLRADWLRTGDIGYVKDGKVYIIGRAKDLIKVNGWQVAPAELESALLESADIIDAAAISAGSGVDEHPVVFLVAKHDGLDLKDIEGLLRSRLARYKVATVDVRFIDSIPRNSSGKILRKQLRERI